MNLSKRPCHIGNSMSTNTEKHGGEDVSAIDLPLQGLMLNAKDLNALLGNGAHAALYHYPQPNGEDAGMPEPVFPMLKELGFKYDFEGATVSVTLGFDADDDEDALELYDCKVKNVKLTPQSGGLTMLNCSVRAKPEPEEVAKLYQFLNHDISVAIADAKKAAKGKDKQKDLPLGESAEAEESEEAPA